ncbi:MAG: hypothetical protein DRH17_07695 [Deltaproteobacteria bacterium]|nr:MAG: hypothetical protein DRH17_07695 [Deltaproteobacteria bacterium]
MEEREFFEKYNINESGFNKAGLNWDELITIKNDHIKNRDRLEAAARYVEERLKSIEQVHTIKTRIKDPEHLIEKIVRRTIQDPTLRIDVDNYHEVITDLVGVRILHLFKEDWESIHEFIVGTWDLKEKPVANVCRGDHEEFINKFEKRGCAINTHPFGYRSVHYLVSFEPSRVESTIVEIQVRTILEEAWCEIDHKIRYPYGVDNPILSPYLVILNRLVGNADEMGSFIKLLQKEVNKKHQEYERQAGESSNLIKDLENKLHALQIEAREKELLEERVKSLEAQLASVTTMPHYEYKADGFTTYTPNLSASAEAKGPPTNRVIDPNDRKKNMDSLRKPVITGNKHLQLAKN